MRKSLAVLFVAAVVGLAGCGGGGDSGGAKNATMRAKLAGDFTGSSVRIHGARAVAADPTYPCISEFDVCAPLTADGVTQAIPDLCPSMDTPVADWSFSYTLYADDACGATLANMSCVPQPGESLVSGDNFNAVECQTRNGDKTFDLCVVDPITGAGRESCPAALREILVLEPTIDSKPSDITTIATIQAIEDLGFIPVVRTAAEWGAMSTSDFAHYRAIVLADPLNDTATNCTFSPAAFAAAEANTAVWGPAVNGNVLIIGADPTYHVDVHRAPGPSAGAYKLIKDGINFAAWKPYQTGLYVGLACSYAFAGSPTPVPVLSYFGTFSAVGISREQATIVGSAEPLADLTSADLSNWETSIHEYMASINAPPGDFKPFAVYVNPTTGAELPYIVGRGLD